MGQIQPESTMLRGMDSAEKRLNELGYKQELRREMTLFKTLAISFSTMTLFTGITPLYGSSLQYAGPASLVWGWVVVSFFTWFVGIAMAEICSSFPVIGGLVIVIMLPLVSLTTKSASYVFTNFEMGTESTGISSKPYAVILSFLVSQYSLYGYDAAAHLTEETKGADKNGPTAILSSIGIISVFGWAYILALTFCIQDFSYLYDPTNETAGAFVPAQILYDAFHGRYHNAAGAIILLFVIWGSFFFGGLSITTSAARVVYALSRDKGIPFSTIWRQVHPKRKVPSNAVWLCAAICIILGLPILKVNVVFTAITSICTIGWVGGYAVPIFARMVMDEKSFKPGPFYLGRASRPVCLIAFLWICYTCSVFLLPTYYPVKWDTFNYAPVALGVGLGLIMLWWVLDARKWFKGPVRNIDLPNAHK
ncbi:hypothetical protein SLEP1_g49435 [Rubroshorea leprosula]|uniref:Amino acid transporter n=1 Tax=Rubroshorea leprosula TaxID=152421 RepID=A0AAV5LXS3_9ROSI|nr:hypothetical protein SLEP1_g49435 [Rubroshorea leprosula]